MLKMAQQQYIKHLYKVEERSMNEIHKITGFNYRSVRQYAHREGWNEEDLSDIKPESYPLRGELIPVIDKRIAEDRKTPLKQRHTSKRIYDSLRDELGFTGSYSSVKQYIRKKFVMKMTNDGYLPRFLSMKQKC